VSEWASIFRSDKIDLNDAATLERGVFDLEMLRRSGFFIGNARSTFTYTACLFRGRAKVKSASVCELYVSSLK
jgi:hypothetical protein